MMPGMRKHQRGLGAFGSLVVLALFVAGGYYAYKYAMEPDTAAGAPSCKAQLNACTVNCRKTTTEAPQYQACQQECNAKAGSCEEPKRS